MSGLMEQLEIDGDPGSMAHDILKWLDLGESHWEGNVIYVDVDWPAEAVVVTTEASDWSLHASADDFRDQLIEEKREVKRQRRGR